MIVRQRDSVAPARLQRPAGVAELPPSSQLGHINAITHTLEETQPRDKTTHRPAARRQSPTGSAAAGMVFLISDCFDDVEPMLAGAAAPALPRARGRSLFHILHPDEIEFPLDGNIRFIGLEGFEELMTRPHLLRPAYLRIVEKYLEEMQQGVRQQRGGLRPDDDQPPAGQRVVRNTWCGACRRGSDDEREPHPLPDRWRRIPFSPSPGRGGWGESQTLPPLLLPQEEGWEEASSPRRDHRASLGRAAVAVWWFAFENRSRRMTSSVSGRVEARARRPAGHYLRPRVGRPLAIHLQRPGGPGFSHDTQRNRKPQTDRPGIDRHKGPARSAGEDARRLCLRREQDRAPPPRPGTEPRPTNFDD